MRIKNFSAFVVLLLLPWSVMAKKESIFIGGGGEPAGPTTIFDETFKAFGAFNSSSGWATRSYFDGGHPESEKLAIDTTGGKGKPATIGNIKQELQNLKKRILRGELKSGDQLLLTIATHGGKPEKNQLTHSVATSNNEDLNLDEIKEVRDLAERKGISLAIIDSSCYSGYTLKLGTNKTCVITGSGEGLAYNTTGENLLKGMRVGRNLEEVFHEGRRKALTMSAAQIATEPGLKAFELTKVISESMKERSILKGENGSPDKCTITSSGEYSKLLLSLRDIQKNQQPLERIKSLFGVTPDIDNSIKKLHSAIRNYEVQRLSSAKYFQRLEAVGRLNFCTSYQGYPTGCGTLRQWSSLYRSLYNKAAMKKSLTTQEFNTLEQAKTVMQTRTGKEYEKVEAQYNLQDAAYQVARAERDVYDLLYKEFEKKSTKPNPCKEFKL